MAERGMHDSTEGQATDVHIGFPVGCRYVGGNTALGDHGHGLRIQGDRLGHGEFHLTHSIPLADVTGVTIAQRGAEESPAAGPLVVQGSGSPFGLGGVGIHHAPMKITTDVTVRTRDGQEAHWVVEQKGGAWLQDELAGPLRARGIPLG
jgi:hypothetical protein